MSKLNDVFANARKKNKSILIGFITGGDPSPETCVKIAKELVKQGVGIIELGIPFSDPIADGPTIQASSYRALRSGVTPYTVLDIAKRITSEVDIPIVILTYYNPVFKIGLDKFFTIASQSNVSGIVVPDLPPEESTTYRQIARKNNIDTIYLVTPNTEEDRLEEIIQSTTGFIYLITLFGVTGARESFTSTSQQIASSVINKVNGRIPIAVGFGVSKPEHVKLFTDIGVDSVIVGSALIKIITKNIEHENKIIEEIKEYVKKLVPETYR